MAFELNITDVNDEKPLFKSNYTFHIFENNPVPSIIGQVNANDADQGINGQIQYSIVSASPYFSISPIDGILSANISFDYEVKREYNVLIRASDYGKPTLESTTLVTINIINQNEYSPEFEKDIYYFSTFENKTNSTITFIGQVKANDRDYSDHISYSLNDTELLFTIDQDGVIWSSAIFDREVQDEYQFTVVATDNSTDELNGLTTVIIKIK